MINYPIIVLEGSDGTGKSTLARHLVNEYGFKYRHLTYRWKTKMDLYHQAALEMCLRDAETSPVVLDRWWPSEKIYADVYRGGSRWPMWGRMLDRVALRYGVLYCFCIPGDRENYLINFDRLRQTRAEMYDKSMDAVFYRYEEMYQKMMHRRDVVRYDMYRHGKYLDDFCQHLLDNCTFESQGDRHIRWYAGNTTDPRIMLVGDESNPKGRRPTWPFVEHANCSLWLTQKLEELGIPEDNLLWANAYSYRDKMPVFDLWSLARCPHIVALGDHAHSALKGAPISLTLKHPQYYRRFDFNTTELEALRELYLATTV